MLTDYHHQLQAFYQTPLGRLVWKAVSQEVQSYTAEFLGHQLLTLGTLDLRDCLGVCPIMTRFSVAKAASSASNVSVYAELDSLPFVDECMDVIIVPHVFECLEAPERVIHELNRVLMPQGHLLMIGFNPASLWGLLQPCQALLPFRMQTLRVGAVRHLLAATQCVVDTMTTCYFGPPAKHSTPGRAKVWETLGRLGWPSWGAVYVIQAHKQVCPMTPIRPKWFHKQSWMHSTELGQARRVPR